jgi:hypothetical protein
MLRIITECQCEVELLADRGAGETCNCPIPLLMRVPLGLPKAHAAVTLVFNNLRRSFLKSFWMRVKIIFIRTRSPAGLPTALVAGFQGHEGHSC